MSINKTHNLIKKKLPSKINGYKVDKEICKMSEGAIYTGKNLLTYQNVLLKVYNKEIIQFQNQQLSLINNEIFIFKFLSHKNILQLYEIIESKYFIILVFEYFHGEKLSDKLKNITRFNDDEALYIYKQIVDILLYTHSLNICLLNIKPDIFMIDNKNNIKLCDLKYGTLYKDNEKIENSNKELENIFACPEVHIRKPFIPELADTYSSGVVLYYILTGEHPFNDINDLQLIKSILKSEYILREGINNDFLDLFDNLLDYREDKRYKLKNIYESKLFKSKNINMPIAPLGYSSPIIKDIMNLCKINYGIKPIVVEKNIKENNLDKHTSLYKQVINNIRKEKKDFGMIDSNDGDNFLKTNLDFYLTQQKENKTKNKEKENKFLENQKNILKSIENVKVKYLLYKKNKEVEEQKAKNAEKNQNLRQNRFKKFSLSKNINPNIRKRKVSLLLTISFLIKF
jgi:serine/threonine protein kinase